MMLQIIASSTWFCAEFILTTSPADKATDVPITSTITVTVDPKKVSAIDQTLFNAKALSVCAKGRLSKHHIRGYTVVGETPLRRQTVTFTPSQPLSYDTTYKVLCASAAYKMEPGYETGFDYEFSFTTSSPPLLRLHVCANDPKGTSRLCQFKQDTANSIELLQKVAAQVWEWEETEIARMTVCVGGRESELAGDGDVAQLRDGDVVVIYDP